MRTRSLFSGIEGFGLGLTMAGLQPEVVDVAEIDPFAQRVLRSRIPGVTVVPDVREIDAGAPRAEVLTAGFPCQPVSQAGLGKAQDDERWLWPEVDRIIRATRPELVFLENVRGLILEGRGMGDVLADLRAAGYSCQWDLIPALAVGAPHLRHRVWIVAYPSEIPMGPIFGRPPWVFGWPPDPAELEGDLHIPRLIRNVGLRRERLTALGNAVVPQCVASVAINAIAARTLEPITPPTLIPEDWPTKFPVAGALIDGHLFKFPTSVIPGRPARFWPTPDASGTGWTLEALSRCVDGDGNPARDPHKRFYHAETGQIVQRTLDSYVKGAEAGLWPIPTPTAMDAHGSRRATARTKDWTSGAGVTLTDYAWIEELPPEHWPQPRNGEELVYPTPVANDARRSTSGPPDGKRGEALVDAVERLWPTPKASPSGPDYARMNREGSGGDDLATAVARAETGRTRQEEQLWQTPTAAPWSGGGGGGELVRQIKDRQGEEIGPWSRDPEVFPTPSATDHKGVSAAGQRRGQLEERVKFGSGRTDDDPGRSLNPAWVEWVMGYPRGWTDPEASTTLTLSASESGGHE